MGGAKFQEAAEEAQKLLILYSPNKPPRFAAPGTGILQPERTIRQALEEAQFILNQTSKTALESRILSLSVIRRRQRIINGLHLLTGSGFVLLIANLFPEPTKWVGAIVSLSAGILALTQPGDASAIEREIFSDTDAVSNLSGQIARIQTELLLKNAELDEKLAGEISTVIGKSMELSTKYR